MSRDDGRSSTTFLRILLLVVGTLSLLLVLPFLQPVMAGGLLAYLVVPVSDRLRRRLGPTLAVTVTILATVLVVLVPLMVVVVVAAEQAASLLGGAEIPDVAAVEALLQGWLGTTVDLSRIEGPLSGALQTGFRGLLGGGVLFLSQRRNGGHTGGQNQADQQQNGQHKSILL